MLAEEGPVRNPKLLLTPRPLGRCVRATASGLSSLIAALLVVGTASAQSLTVGSGVSLNLAEAVIDLGCSDLVVAGSADLASSAVTQAGDVSIQGGGSLSGGNSTLLVTGDWSLSGVFLAGSGAVHVVDGCGSTFSTISSGTTFYDLELSTLLGKQVEFEAGGATAVGGTFKATGAAGNLLRIRSTVDGSAASLLLGHVGQGEFVDVKDNHVDPGMVFLGPESELSGNAIGWRLGPYVPSLGGVAMLLLTGSLVWTASIALGGRRATATNPSGQREGHSA